MNVKDELDFVRFEFEMWFESYTATAPSLHNKESLLYHVTDKSLIAIEPVYIVCKWTYA